MSTRASCLELLLYGFVLIIKPFFFSVSVPSLFFPFSDAQSSPLVSLSYYLWATITYWVWHARNVATFSVRLPVLSSLYIVDLIKKDVSLRVRCSPWDEITNVWSSSSVLCSVDSMDNIIFFP